MSFFSSIGSILRKVAAPIIGAINPLAGAVASTILARPQAPAPALPARRPLPGVGAATTTLARFSLPALRPLPRVPGLPAPRAMPLPVPGAPQPMGAIAASPTGCPPGWHPNKQAGKFGAARTYCVRNRRMNFMNPRAAMRAIRRVKAARKTLQKIERMLPKTRTTRRHHEHPHHHRT